MAKLTQEQELEILRNQVANLEREKQEQAEAGDKYLREVQEIRRAKKGGMNNVEIRPLKDYRISLWHTSGHNIGKRVGPIDPELAEATMLEFAGVGIKLSIHRPTEEFINKYKLSTEYKVAAEKEFKRRSAKNKSRKESQVEKLSNAIEKLTGIKGVNSIKDQSEVM